MMAIPARSGRPFKSTTSLYPPAVFRRHLDLTRNLDGVEQMPHLIGLHDGRDTHLTAESGTFDEHRRIFGNDLLDDEPVEKAAQRSQVLLNGGFRVCRLQLPDQRSRRRGQWSDDVPPRAGEVRCGQARGTAPPPDPTC